MQNNELPLFPLGSVLFPGGRLELRIFERRYLDLIRDCARENVPFGVCLILKGNDAGTPATPAAFGTCAHIEDFSTTSEGLLGIAARGGQRFYVESVRIKDSGLIVAQVQYLPIEPPMPMPTEFSLLATILQRFGEQFGGELGAASKDQFDDAVFVANRLAEILPLSKQEQLQILQCTDAKNRLALLAQWLPKFQRD